MLSKDLTTNRSASRRNAFQSSIKPSEVPPLRYQPYKRCNIDQSNTVNAGHGYMAKLDVQNGRTPPPKRRRVEHGLNPGSDKMHPHRQNYDSVIGLTRQIPGASQNRVSLLTGCSTDEALNTPSHSFARVNNRDAKPPKQRNVGALRGQTSALPFVVDDETDDELNNVTQQGQRSRRQVQGPKIAEIKAEERRESQELRAQAMRRKHDPVRPSTSGRRLTPVSVIDLCSPTRSTFELCMNQSPESTQRSHRGRDDLLANKIDIDPDPISGPTNHEVGRAKGQAESDADGAKPIRQAQENDLKDSRLTDKVTGTTENVRGTEKGTRASAGSQKTSQSDGQRAEPHDFHTREFDKQRTLTETHIHDKETSEIHESSHNDQCWSVHRVTSVENRRTTFTSISPHQYSRHNPSYDANLQQEIATNRNIDLDIGHEPSDLSLEKGSLEGSSRQRTESNHTQSVQQQQQDNSSQSGDHNDQHESSASFPGADLQQQRREERIRKMQQRNQQNRDLGGKDKIDEDEPVRSSVATLPSALHTPPGQPTTTRAHVTNMLHSDNQHTEMQKPVIHGRNPSTRSISQTCKDLVDRPDRSALQQESKGDNQTCAKRKHSSHERKLGDIDQEDYRLLDLIQKRTDWNDVPHLFEIATGKKKAVYTLKRRFRKVQAALKNASISEPLIAQAILGNENSIKQINASVQQSPYKVGEGVDAVSNTISSDRADGMIPRIPKNKPKPASSTTTSDKYTQTLQISSKGEKEVPSIDSIQDNGSEPDTSRRSMTGGKSINWQNWLDILHVACDEPTVEEQESDQLSDHSEEIDEEDFCHFEYQVQRRECTVEEFENGTELDDVPWMECQHPFESLAQANAAAARQVYRSLPGSPQFANPDGDFIVSQRTAEDGMKVFSLENRDLGTVETRVTRNMRLYHEGILPRSSEGMLRRIGYLVKWRVTKNCDGNDLFEDCTVSVEQGVLDAIYTILDIANQQAIAHYVELTFKSSIMNLDMRRQEKQQKIKDLLEEVEGDADGFNKSSGEGTARKVEVWVDRLPIKGPRNLY